MAERVMDTRASAALLRHRWPLLFLGGLVGVALGLVYAVLVPMELTSTSWVLLSAAGPQSPSNDMTDIETQVHLVESTPVLKQAGLAVRPALSPSQVASKLAVEGTTARLIEIHASSPRAEQAQALSQAVAEAYVNTLSENVRSATGERIGELRERETRLRQQIKALQDQITAANRRKGGEDPGSPEARRDGQLSGQLAADQAAATLKLDQVQTDLANSAVAGVAEPASIIQPASSATGPASFARRLASASAGAVLLCVLTAVGLLIRARHDPRLRTRDDLADAVGSTVLADIRSRPQRSVAEWSALFETYTAPAVDAWAFRQVLRSLAVSPDHRSVARTAAKRPPGRVEHPRSVTVVCLGGDRRGLAVGPQLASFTASLGMTTRFVAGAGHSSAASLRAACSSDRAARLRAGLVLDAQADDRDLNEVGAYLPRPVQTFDELLRGLLLTGSREGENEPDADRGAVESSETVEKHDDDVHERPLVARSDSETGQELEPHPAPDIELSTEAVAPGSAVRVVPKHLRPDLTVVLAVVDRRKPTLSGLPATAVTVLAISPGFGNREELARLAVAVDDSGRRFDGIIIADPDPADATTGRRTLDERALEVPLPVRVTGVSQLPLSGGDRGKSG